MSDVPKIVHDRLRAGAPGGAHPNADLLTAFSEQALSGAEREGVVRHLSRCADCRDVVALSIPPVESVAQPRSAREGVAAEVSATGVGLRSWFAWPNLRWAAMAAAVVVAGSILLLRPGKQPGTMVDSVNRQAERSPSAAKNAERATSFDSQPARSVSASPAKPDNSPAPEGRASRMIPPQRTRAQAQAVDAIAPLGDKRTDSLERKRNRSFEADNLALQAPAAPPASAIGGTAPAARPGAIIGSSRETVEVNGAAEAVQSAPIEGRLMAGAEITPPIEKAKPATKEEVQPKAQLTNNEAPNKLASYPNSDTAYALQKQRSKQSKDVAARWSLAQGKLQRSLDAGATWLIALQLEHPLLSFGARGGDVWAGGQAGTLFHSIDSGTTWSMVQASTKSESLSSDIIAIEIRSPVEIVLSTSNNEFWTTVDAGKTWEKK